MSQYRLSKMNMDPINPYRSEDQSGTAEVAPPAVLESRTQASRSLPGFTPAPKVAAVSLPPVKNTEFDAADLQDLTSKDLLRGFILSEILGRPKSLRKGRW